jgi:F-type H+-transporting ATPase subunit a
MFFFTAIFNIIEQSRTKVAKGFIPTGVPVVMSPILFIIEIASFLMRVLSLAIRLFINLFAGHLILKIIVTGTFYMMNLLYITFSLQFIAVPFTLLFYLIEIVACGLQAIVLISLISIYLNHALNFYSH